MVLARIPLSETNSGHTRRIKIHCPFTHAVCLGENCVAWRPHPDNTGSNDYGTCDAVDGSRHLEDIAAVLESLDDKLGRLLDLERGDGFFTAEFVRDKLIPEINAAIGDGATLEVKLGRLPDRNG